MQTFNFSKFLDLMKIDIKKAFKYRDSCFVKKEEEKKAKKEKKKEYTREEIMALLDKSWIKYSKRLKSETLFKKALDNNLV